MLYYNKKEILTYSQLPQEKNKLSSWSNTNITGDFLKDDFEEFSFDMRLLVEELNKIEIDNNVPESLKNFVTTQSKTL
jgi:hypothetical protein